MDGVTTPIVVGFDVEPDGLDIPRRERPPWRGFERTLELSKIVRGRLETELGEPVRFSWFLRMDPQIADVYGSPTWVVEEYGPALERLRREGDELGLHPHALRWDERRGGWLTDTADQGWVEQCVRESFGSFRNAIGIQCRVHRFGDRYMSSALVAVLREIGVAVDLTLEPGRGPALSPTITEPVPDMTGIPRVPYQPHPADYRRPVKKLGPDGLWMLPLASANPDRALPAWRRAGRRLRHAGKPRHRPILLWAPWPSELLWDIVARDVEAGELLVLPFVVRADTLLEPAWAERFEAHMLALAHHRLGRSARLVTPSAAMWLSRPM